MRDKTKMRYQILSDNIATGKGEIRNFVYKSTAMTYKRKLENDSNYKNVKFWDTLDNPISRMFQF